MLRELTIVNCSLDSDGGPFDYLLCEEEPEPHKREKSVWGCINHAFSEPVTRSDDVAEYAPTQVLAEAFRNAGYDDIVYGSKLGKGKTVAIFDMSAADLCNCHLYQVETVNLTFSMRSNPNYTLNHYRDTPKNTDCPEEAPESEQRS